MNCPLYYKYLNNIEELIKNNKQNAIHASLMDIFLTSINVKPKLIVELGVSQSALANKILWRVADLYNADLISCDVSDFSSICNYQNWHFVRSDDISFSNNFLTYCKKLKLRTKIDILLIDTDEKYPHTLQEIKFWFPYLSKKCCVFFRCTNLKHQLYYKDGTTTGLGWDNNRGVIKAIEEYLHKTFDETKEFETEVENWKVIHQPYGAGLTTLIRNES
jgi:hypothetical protein